ncbi:MAG: 1-deoxy-D-xylulose-5-phosphate synthase [Pseudomonadales bacterium]|jgi:1-deoxy-D-xylulose-5-phosphate synthase|nr:1-deoxy-D-xylulose-5-phosphate synthase [Pseudomonadales bacterium]
MASEIPLERPLTPLLDAIETPSELRELDPHRLPELAAELREYLLWSVGRTGGHFGAGLGVVELTIALHFCFETPEDLIVWDVGHQAYPHKILTGRRERMTTMRQTGGLAPFPDRTESAYDTFGVGHSSTSISAALGMALAARMQGRQRRVAAVIGDGALTAGLAFEALNHAAETGADLLVILNDNAMSISHNVGGLSRYLARVLASRFYASVRGAGKRVLSSIPPVAELARRTEEHMKGLVLPGTLFEELGFNYIGPVHGHDLEDLVTSLQNVRDLPGPQFLHVVTQKGRGYEPAEKNPVGLHALTKIEPPGAEPKQTGANTPKYSNVFGRWLVDIAEQDERVVGITPAMREGSDLVAFSERFPERYHDVAIAEQHAVTLAAGLACEGAKPVVAIYSTFLQRGYDQLIHDVAIQNLDVTFALDRAGIVDDGPTHAGIFDLSFLRCVPNMIVMAPSDENETRQMLYTGWAHEGPAAIRYPRGRGPGVVIEEEMTALPIGKSRTVRDGERVALLAFGSMVTPSLGAGDELDATVVDMRFVKPLDEDRILELARDHELLVTIEENVVAGGAGSGVGELLANAGVSVPLLHLGLRDGFPPHGNADAELAEQGLDTEGIVAAVRARLGSARPEQSTG